MRDAASVHSCHVGLVRQHFGGSCVRVGQQWVNSACQCARNTPMLKNQLKWDFLVIFTILCFDHDYKNKKFKIIYQKIIYLPLEDHDLEPTFLGYLWSQITLCLLCPVAPELFVYKDHFQQIKSIMNLI